MKNKDLIYKHALANAFQHNGKASAGAVIGRVLGENPELRKNMKDLQKDIADAVKKANKLKPAEQEKELQKIYPEVFDKKEINKELPELPNANQGKVVTRLPPEPNGHLHIGHAISFYFNEYYARKYNGKLVLRFEDTNPEHEKAEFYASIEDDLNWLGIKYDTKKNNSDDMELFYKSAEKLINAGVAYACRCPVEQVRKFRFSGTECDCRDHPVNKNLEIWEQMHTDLSQGSAVLRLKGNLKEKNTVLRDPTLFRITETPHPLQGNKYRVWPLYDFANSIQDAVCGITHVLRSNEFHQRNILQNTIRDLLGLKNPEIISYSRIMVEGTPTSKRQINALIETGSLKKWDDPRLATIKALRRRGILPETLRELAMEVRMTSGSTTIDWDKIAGINSKFLDEISNRYFFVPDPVKIEVKNAPTKIAELKMHPNIPKRGTRKVPTNGVFYIPSSDKFKKGEIFRLKDLYNITYIKEGEAEFAGEEILPKTQKVQWVTEANIETEILVPGILMKNKEIDKNSLHSVRGLAEIGLSKLKPGDTIQAERFGFVKLERTKDKITGILTHK